MEDKELPRYLGPVDHLKMGFRSLQSELVALHPVAVIQKADPELNWSNKLKLARSIHGSGFAMRLATEHALLQQNHRLPGLSSSSIRFETISGNDTKIGFEDFLNGLF
jgi:hypothetical protein